MKKSTETLQSWKPTYPVSKGASAYHNAVVNTSWHKKNISQLLQLVQKKIHPHDVVVDFGSGTGASSIYLYRILPKNAQLVLVDNSPSWLGKAYNLLHAKKNISFLILEKIKKKYQRLDEIMKEGNVDCVVCANTVHLIPVIDETFDGIYSSLKKHGTFTFQSGNIGHRHPKDVMMIEDSVRDIHKIAIHIIKTDSRFETYKKNVDTESVLQLPQMKFVFPDPRPISFYVEALKRTGFVDINVSYRNIKVLYTDWLKFLSVRRLQAGILPEIGGKDPTSIQAKDRDLIIKLAAQQFFQKLKRSNSLATNRSFTAEWTYVQARKE